ncbi:MAG TPA: AraC family transcriptional regulator [Polyangiaceae bacterium]|nr:AraC family transcriptional regulator [Polyangiaceae bacterium]
MDSSLVSPPSLDASVGVSLVRSIVQEFERTGLDAERLLSDASVPASILDDPYARLDLARYRDLQRLALAKSGDPAFGLSMGEHASLGAFGIVGHMVMHCRSLRQALDLCARYYLLVADADAPRYSERNGEVTLAYEYLRGTDEACNRMRAEFGLTRLVLTARTLLNQDIVVRRATFEHPAPEYAARYVRTFGPDVRFGEPRTTLVFPGAVLDTRLLHHDEGVLSALRDQADRMLAELGEPGTFARKLRRAVQASLPGVPPDGEALARKLGVSGRSLRRLLRQEGHTVQSVVAEALRDAAFSLLADPAVTIQDAAHRLGFSEPSAFHRAFKRWTGITPAEWRKKQDARLP